MHEWVAAIVFSVHLFLNKINSDYCHLVVVTDEILEKTDKKSEIFYLIVCTYSKHVSSIDTV